MFLLWHEARAPSRDPHGAGGFCPEKTSKRGALVRGQWWDRCGPDSRVRRPFAFSLHASDRGFLRRSRSVGYVRFYGTFYVHFGGGRESRMFWGRTAICTLTSSRVRADRSALYSMETSALPPVERPTLDRYEYFLATVEDIVVRFSYSHCVTFGSRRNTANYHSHAIPFPGEKKSNGFFYRHWIFGDSFKTEILICKNSTHTRTRKIRIHYSIHTVFNAVEPRVHLISCAVQ